MADPLKDLYYTPTIFLNFEIPPDPEGYYTLHMSGVDSHELMEGSNENSSIFLYYSTIDTPFCKAVYIYSI